MAWYGSGGWDYYPPYISVGQKKARGMLTLAKLLKKSKRTAEPVVLAHRKRQLAATFWGQAWADNLERYADLANRLPRGRAYLRNGSVLDLAIGRGRVDAYVAGTELYRVTIGMAPLAKTRAAPFRSSPGTARCRPRRHPLVRAQSPGPARNRSSGTRGRAAGGWRGRRSARGCRPRPGPRTSPRAAAYDARARRARPCACSSSAAWRASASRAPSSARQRCMAGNSPSRRS